MEVVVIGMYSEVKPIPVSRRETFLGASVSEVPKFILLQVLGKLQSSRC